MCAGVLDNDALSTVSWNAKNRLPYANREKTGHSTFPSPEHAAVWHILAPTTFVVYIKKEGTGDSRDN